MTPLPSAWPTGTVTFLMSEVDGRHDEAALRHHVDTLQAVVDAHGGMRPTAQPMERGQIVAAFARASDAVATTLAVHRALQDGPHTEDRSSDDAGGRVRMALHTGEARLAEDGTYDGPAVVRGARLRALAHAGQVLISTTAADLLADGLPGDAALLPLGLHRLKDLRTPERVFQLVHPSLPAQFPPLRSLDASSNNLPAQLTSFVGRNRELAELAALLGEPQLVTLVGAGGCGKTRLAAQVAAEVADGYPDGAWWVELAPLPDAGLVTRAVMTALGLLDSRGRDPQVRITGHLAGKRALLVLDNCEHVTAGAAHLIDGVLRACPGIAVLATSREPLGIAGERVWRVPALSLPPMPVTPVMPHGGEPEMGEILASESVRLFLDRAVEARRSFRLEASTAQTVAAVCARLDGIPLAIELAAARIRTLSPERILDGLGSRFGILTDASADAALPRQQTLEASVGWSHDLLSDAERVLFRRLAAFSGGFSLEAAEAVAAGDPLEGWEILTLLSDLVDKSLVIYDGDRYGLLQTVHQYARARLGDAGETTAVESRHRAWSLRLAEDAATALETRARADVLLTLEQDHDNLRAALDRAVAAGESDTALRLVIALGPFWVMRGHYFEALTWFRRVLAAVPSEPSPLRARALGGLGRLGLFSMDLAGGYGALEMQQAAALAGQLDDPRLLSRAVTDQLLMMSFVAPDAAAAAMDDCLAAARRTGGDWELLSALNLVSFVWGFQLDRADRAEPYLDELARLAHRSGSAYWAVWHGLTSGIVAWRQGRLAAARRTLEVASEAAWDLGDPMLEAWTTSFLANVYIAQGDRASTMALVSRSQARQVGSAYARAEFVQARLAVQALADGDVIEARRQLEATEEPLRECGFPMLAAAVAALCGRMALEEGDTDAARIAVGELESIAGTLAGPWMLVEADDLRGRLERADGAPSAAEEHHLLALSRCVAHGFRGAAADTLECLGSLAAAGGSAAEAARLLGTAQALRDDTGQARWALDQRRHDADCAGLRAELGDPAFEEAWQQGRALSLEEVAAYASRARGERKRPSSGWSALTPTELEVVALATQGLTNAQIGGKLFITAGTAKVHLSNIYRKLGVANRAQLAAQATARGADRVG